MLISKKKDINTSIITTEEIRLCHAELSKGSSVAFQRLVIEPQSLYLVNLVQSEFPALKEEAPDIIADVFLKFRKEILNKRVPQEDFDLIAHLATIIRTDCKMALPNPENLQKNFKLSRKAYKDLLAKLRNGDEEIIELVYLSQFKRCISFLMHNCSASYDDAYSSTIEALIEIRKDMIAGKIFYGNLDFYFTRRAKSKWYKLNIKNNGFKKVNNLADMDFEEEEKIETELYTEELKELVKAGLNKLCDDCKNIIRLYYYDEMSLKEIAELLDKSHDAVRKQATRCRDKLRGHLGEKFYAKFGLLLKD